MGTRILDAERDTEEWCRVLESLPVYMRDLYFHPDWVGLHRLESEAQALLFTFRRADDVWIYPFLLKPIVSVGTNVLDQTWFDLETAYGYGGPLATTRDPDFLARAHNTFKEWCREQKVVAEFIRLHPLVHTRHWLDNETEIIYDRETVSLDLTNIDNGDSLFDKDTRYMLRRAGKAGVCVTTCPSGDCFRRFVDLYLTTMDRVGADDYYYFNEDYFRGLEKLVRDMGWLLVAERGQEWAAAAVFLRGSSWLHYHLSASDPDERVPGVNNLLLYAAAQIGDQYGLKRLHLGGGLTRSPDDSLLEFKRSMSTDAHSFYIGKRIHNREVYISLQRLWRQNYPSLVPVYGDRVLCYRYEVSK